MEARTQEGDKLGLRARAGNTTKIIKKKKYKVKGGTFQNLESLERPDGAELSQDRENRAFEFWLVTLSVKESFGSTEAVDKYLISGNSKRQGATLFKVMKQMCALAK
jgi:hypothetical protein